jgi:AbiJ N-terminal domain 3/TIR domain
MNYFELRPSNANYSASDFLSRIDALFHRDTGFIGPIVQRSALVRSATGQIEHNITKIEVLPHPSALPRPDVLDYGPMLFVTEHLERSALFERLKRLSEKEFTVGAHRLTTPGSGFSDRYEASANAYSSWPYRLFDVSFSSSQLYYGDLLHPDLKSFASASAAIREILELNDFHESSDGRVGHILLYMPNLNARLGRLVLKENRLYVPVEARAKRASLKLDINYKGEAETKSLSLACPDQGDAVFELSFTPTELQLWLVSREGFLADFHDENEYYSRGSNPVLLKRPVRTEILDSSDFFLPDATSSVAFGISSLPQVSPYEPTPGIDNSKPKKMTEVTRRDLVDLLLLRDRPFHGRLDLMSFLRRIWTLDSMASTDSRFDNAAGDIWQHMVNNSDWSFSELLYERLDVLGLPDEQFGRFLEMCVHPLVLPDKVASQELVRLMNSFLLNDGFLLQESEHLSGKLVYKLTAAAGDPQFGKAFEIVLSFAGEDRQYVVQVAEALRKQDVSVFYDGYEEATLWGKDLVEHLHQVYSGSARFCVMFISKHYEQKMWPTHERRSAFERAIEDKQEYILPARFDSTPIPGLRKTVGYVDLAVKTPDQLAELILRKLGRELR